MTEEIPFPNGHIDGSIEHKLFKHVLFKTDKKLTDFRIKAIGHDWTELHEVQHSQLSIPLESWDLTKDKVRIKAVLSAPDHGVLESDWVSQQVLGAIQKRKLNQFRVRGVSDTNIRSRWIYSELKDEDDELVVFQLLHDILDMMTVVHEHDLTSLIDVSIVDMLIGLMNGNTDGDLKWINSLELENENFKYDLLEHVNMNGVTSNLQHFFMNAGMSETIYNEFMRDYFVHVESKKAKIKETAELVGKYFKKNFLEQKRFSTRDIMDHAKTWKIKEDYITEVLDHMLEHIFMISVEDSYEKAVEEASLVALLQGDEQILSLLNDTYEFEAESAINELFVHTEFIESFVSYFSDGLKLLIESHIDEAASVAIIEDAIPTLLLVYKEVFIPMQKLDEAAVDLFSDLEDDAKDIYKKMSTSTQGLQFEYFDEESGEVWRQYQEYLTELFEYLLMTDDHMELQVDSTVFSLALNSLKKDSLKALIIYDPVEAIEYIAQLAENVKTSFSIWKNVMSEQSNLQLQEVISSQTKGKYGVNDTQSLKKEEDLVFSSTLIQRSFDELTKLLKKEDYVLDLDKFREILENYKLLLLDGYTLQDILSNKDLFIDYNLKVLDVAVAKDTITQSKIDVSSYVTLIHDLILKDLTKDLIGDFDVPAYAHEHLELLYRINLKDKFIGPFMRQENSDEEETAEMFPTFYRYDDYFNVMWNLKENVHVHLGELDLTGGRFPVGYFVLGKNTLEGEKT